MELNSSIEPTIGPYEVYEDEWFNFKAGFEAFITLTDFDETRKLERFSSELQDLENHLPIDPKYPAREARRLLTHPRGQCRLQLAATAITTCRPPPSTCRTTSASCTEKGSKRTMLKNFQQAKFDKVLLPIADVAIVPAGPAARARSSRSSLTC